MNDENKNLPWQYGNPKNPASHFPHFSSENPGITPSMPVLQVHFPVLSQLPFTDPFISQLHSIKDRREIEKGRKNWF